jgi:murein DD-endopeptidase MepM/ murein hydrolase activator NlpD
MSAQPFQSPYEYPRHSEPDPRRHSAATVSRHIQSRSQSHASDYTLVHAGRQVRIGPVAFWIVVGSLVVMGVWSIATGTYFTFKDDVLTRLIGRQAEMQFAYEDRIADLRAQVDRITSRQLLDQEQFEKKLEALLRRQAALEQRSNALSGDQVIRGPLRGAHPGKPAPMNESSNRSGGFWNYASAVRSGAGLDGILNRVSRSLDGVEQKQTAALTTAEERLDAKTNRIRTVLAGLNVDLGKAADVTGGIGGPLVPLRAPKRGASDFERQLYQVNLARAQLDKYDRILTTVPLRKPVLGDIDMSSPFGTRMDPFMGGPAIHTGIDLRGDTGDPVRATADGTVTIASWQGGYGNMVEIDHHNGLATRFGHMSKILVKVGQRVHIGQTIGLIGSTGRSTGPHLHYETRVHGSAVNPQRFFNAGEKLGTF